MRVLTVNTGAIQTNLFANAYGGTQVPADSLYAPISKDIENRLSGKEMEGQLGKPEDFAKALAGDMIGGTSGYVSRGKMFSFIRFATLYFPAFLLVSFGRLHSIVTQ